MRTLQDLVIVSPPNLTNHWCRSWLVSCVNFAYSAQLQFLIKFFCNQINIWSCLYVRGTCKGASQLFPPCSICRLFESGRRHLHNMRFDSRWKSLDKMKNLAIIICHTEFMTQTFYALEVMIYSFFRISLSSIRS